MNLHYNHIRNAFIILTILSYSCKSSDNDLKIHYPPGGYDFSKNITDTNFYHYPLIGKISRSDSFDIAYSNAFFFHVYKEPNISLKSADKAIFRLSFTGNIYSYIIRLTADEIIVKMNFGGRYWPEVDTDKLTETERYHFNILRREFPLDEPRSYDGPPAPPPPPDQVEEALRSKKRYDSIVKNTRRLLDPAYYDFLLKKAAVNTKDTFSFSTKTIKISRDDFKRVVELINHSGYWKMAYEKIYSGTPDATFYLLEANNGKKYNAVVTEDIFSGAYEELIKIAKIREETEKFHKAEKLHR